MADINEKWAPVPVGAFATAYEVSTLGRVRTVPRIVGNEQNYIRRIHCNIMKGRTAKDGHRTVILCFQRQRQKFSIRNLVADAFIPNPERLSEVIHKNGDQADCRADNLERTAGAVPC